MKRYKYVLAAGCVVFGIFVLFLEPAQYFFGDSIAVLWGRPHSFGSLMKDFARLDGGHWYRPLSNSLPPYVLWPLFAMEFQGYHLLALVLHSLFCVGLCVVLQRVLRDSLAGFVAAAFFAFHPIQFYATYDLAFYQEPLMAALTVASLLLLLRFAERPRAAFLALALMLFVAALSSKETSVVMPALLFLVIIGRTALYRLPSTRIALISAVGIASAFTLIYALVLGVTFRYQPAYSPRLQLNAFSDAISALFWSFAIPSGVQTQGWQYSLPMSVGLWLLFFVIAGVAIARPSSGVWRGFVWFFLAAGPAFFTHHLLPHHLYLGLVGIAYSVGKTIAWLRSQQHYSPSFRSAASALSSLAVAIVFCAGYIDARADSTQSWVGESSLRVRQTSDFFRSAKIDLSKSQGIMAVIGDAQDLRFDWMGGAFFNMIGSDDLETRIIDHEPDSVPEGFYVVMYSRSGLHRLTNGETVRRDVSEAGGTLPSVQFQLTTRRVYAGRDSFCLQVPRFAGQTIDVRYHYNERPPSIAYSFARLNAEGTACINVDAAVPWGDIKVVGVRPSGSLPWYSTNAEIQVLPPPVSWWLKRYLPPL